MERQRFTQIKKLQECGWKNIYSTVETNSNICGGPTYMLDPDGKLYEVGTGVEKLVQGLLVYKDGRQLEYKDGVIV